MNNDLSKVEQLFSLTEEVAKIAQINIAQSSQSNSSHETRLHMYNSRNKISDEIWLFSGKAGAKTKQPLVKVLLTGLSKKERKQLDLKIKHYNTSHLYLNRVLNKISSFMKQCFTQPQLLLISPRAISNES